MRVLAVENVAVEFARRPVYRALARMHDFDVHLLVPFSWRDQGLAIGCEPEESASLHIHPTKVLFGNRTHRVLYRELFRLVGQLKPDILYVDAEPENYAAVQALLSLRVTSRSTRLALVSSRTIDHRRVGFPYRLSMLHRICDGVIRRYPPDLLFVRPKSAIPLMANYARTIVELPHVVDCSVFRRGRSRRSGGRQLTIGYLGRLVEEKGIPLLIETMRDMPEHVNLMIVGSGKIGGQLEELVRSFHISDRVRFHSAVRYADVPGILNRFDILVLPSIATKYWNEQFGRVLIEAMACGVPVVGSDSGGIPDVVGDAGLLFRSGDRVDLARKILQLVSDPGLRRKYQLRGRDRAVTLFDAPVIATKMADAFRSVLACC